MKLTRLQIVRTLKERGWTKKRSLWYAPKEYSKHFQTLGIDLRNAASLEMLEANESLSETKTPTAKQKAFASEVAMLKHKAGELGLFYTMQKLDAAVTMVGYELAGTPELDAKAKL